MKIYLVVMYDRHCDDAYSAHLELYEAENRCDTFMKSYGDRYKWEKQNVRGWLYSHHTDSDDGPRVHIEDLELL